MTHSPYSRQIAALTPYVRGIAIELTGPEPGLLAGTTPIRAADGTDDWSRLADDSVDSIVGLGAPGALDDPIGEVQNWCRVLREGGSLAVITARTGPPAWLIALIHHVGGLDIVGARAIEQRDQHWLLVAERRAVAEVRTPLGALGPRLAEVSGRDHEALAELYFQIGTILLQTGDPDLASDCFAKLQDAEGRSADALFGLGMCHASAQRWTEAVSVLEQARQLDATNDQIERWLTLAKSKTLPAASAAAPASAPTSSAPSPASS